MITPAMLQQANLRRMPGKSRKLMLWLNLAAFAGSMLPATPAKARASRSEHAIPSSKAAKPGFGVKKHTLLSKRTNPSELRTWVDRAKAFTESQVTDAIMNGMLPSGSIFLIDRQDCLAVCKATPDSNYEELVGRFPIEQFSALILKTAIG
jgi:hypothetical protein